VIQQTYVNKSKSSYVRVVYNFFRDVYRYMRKRAYYKENATIIISIIFIRRAFILTSFRYSSRYHFVLILFFKYLCWRE